VKAALLKAPFPYFGGKARVAAEVWSRLGDCDNFIEPFFGSGAVLLARPHGPARGEHRIETVNDADRFLANFWRALQADPDAVAAACDWPVNETDLHARHRWLVTEGAARIAACADDPAHYDAEVAGWWVWGASAWIGSGWCETQAVQLPHFGDDGRGVHRPRMDAPALPAKLPNVSEPFGRGGHRAQTPEQIPHLSDSGAGVHRPRVSERLPHLSDKGAGSGGHRYPQPTVPLQVPHLSNAGQGVTALARRTDLLAYLRALSARLRFVRVACGDFARVLGPSVTTRLGTTGVFLDPPYGEGSVDYAAGGNATADVFQRAAAWAVENADDPRLRIALCGYEGAFEPPAGWTTHRWKTRGGYGSQGNGAGRENARRERVWFSPHCLTPQPSLFDA